MEGSSTKGLELNDSDADIRKSSRSSIVNRIYVEGYDTSLSGRDLVMSMREHFASCGEVLHVYIPGYASGRNLNRFALIYLRGEGAEEKALKLSGSYMGAHKLVVEPYPFHAKNLDHVLATTRYADNKEDYMASFDGYDTRLPLEYAKRMLSEEFSQCGRVLYIDLCEEIGGGLSRYACVDVVGIDTLEKLLQLSGCDRKGLENLKITKVAPPEQDGASACDVPPLWSLAFSCSSTSVMADTAPEDPNLPKPPCTGNLLPYPWRCRVDSGTGYSSVWNTVTGAEFEKPPSSAPVRYALEDPSLPKPWKALVDSTTGYGYFWNTETNVTQYHRPHSSPLPLRLQDFQPEHLRALLNGTGRW